jgi:hypothetical protein
VYSTNKTDRHDTTEILFRVVLNTITLTLILKSLEINNQIENQSHEFFVIHKFIGVGIYRMVGINQYQRVGIEVYHGENKSNRTGATSGAGDANSSGAFVFTPDISGVPVARSLLFCVVFYNSVLAFFFSFLVIVLCVSDCPFGNFKFSSDIQQVGKW